MSMLNILKKLYEIVARTKCTKLLVIYLKEFEKNESKAGDAELSIENLTFTFTFGCTTKYMKKMYFIPYQYSKDYHTYKYQKEIIKYNLPSNFLFHLFSTST